MWPGPQLMQTVINNYGSLEPDPSGTVFRVTPLETVCGGPEPWHDVVRM
jgi:hypothetical protein